MECGRAIDESARPRLRGLVRLPVLIALIGAAAARRLGRRSGATGAEVRDPLPGDDVVARPLWQSTRAITIGAPPSRVWPWIVQMGYPAHRAGWYTPYWLDRLQWGIRERSAEVIVPELQALAVGDRVPDSRDWSAFFTVAALEPERALVLHSSRHILWPMRSNEFSWAFVLEPTGQGATRLQIRARGRTEPWGARLALGWLIGLGDFVNASVMLRGIRARSQGAPMTASPRRLARGAGDVLAGAPLFLLAPLHRRRHLRWGATDAEVAGGMPGDDLVAAPSFCATRAITIDAPPEEVWPWIVQMGHGRAGWYSYDLLDNGGRPSAERILPEHQHLRVGDAIPMAGGVSDATAFRVSGLEPNRWMLWTKPHSTWAWKLVPLDDGRTRLITRLKDRYAWSDAPATALLSLILFELGDFAMMRRLLLGLKRRAEGTGDDS